MLNHGIPFFRKSKKGKDIKQLNHHLNFLPLYASKGHQMRYRKPCKGCLSGHTELSGKVPKVQYYNTSDIDVTSWEIYDTSDNLIVTPPANAWQKSYNTGNNRYWLRYDQGVWAGDGALCGEYYMKVTFSTGLVLYSEVWQSENIDDTQDWFRFTLSSPDSDYDNYLFQINWSQSIYFKAYYDYITEESAPADLTNPRNKVFREFDSTKLRRVLKIPFFPDYLMGAFKAMEMDKIAVTLKDLKNSYTVELSKVLVSFEPSPEGCYLVCNLSYEDTSNVFRGWDEKDDMFLIDGNAFG